MILRGARSYLEGEDALLLDGFDLGDNVVVDPEDGDRNPSTPLVPERRHAALHGDRPRAPRFGAHHPGLRLDDASRAAAGELALVDEDLGGEAPVGEEGRDTRAGTGGAEKAGEEASRGERHGGGGGGGDGRGGEGTITGRKRGGRGR